MTGCDRGKMTTMTSLKKIRPEIRTLPQSNMEITNLNIFLNAEPFWSQIVIVSYIIKSFKMIISRDPNGLDI